MQIRKLPILPLLLALTLPLHAQDAQQTPSTAETPTTPAPVKRALLDRTYHGDQTLKYRMKGSNRGWQYGLLATSHVQQDASGAYYEEVAWSGLHSNANMQLSAASLDFRQSLSLAAPGKYLAIPDLSKVDPWLIGPITDLLTFYSDLFLARQFHFIPADIGHPHSFAYGKPSSWADGRRVLLGQDSMDFEVTLQALDADEHTATLLVRHVPPAHPQIKLPAAWMQTHVAGTPNNWVDVEKNDAGYLAQVGRETFDVTLKVDKSDGRILTAHLHNPVVSVQRTCQDADLSQCGPQTAQTILRDVDLELLP